MTAAGDLSSRGRGGSPDESASQRRGPRLVRRFTAIGLLWTIDTLSMTLTPVLLSAGGMDGRAVGLVVGIIQSIGLVTLVPTLVVAERVGDAASYAALWVGLVVTLVMLWAIDLSPSTRVVLAALCAAVLYGATRDALVNMTIRGVAELPDRRRAQGYNAVAQRFGAGLAGLAVFAVTATATEHLAYTIALALCLPLAATIPALVDRRRVVAEKRGLRARALRALRLTISSYVATGRLGFTDRRVVASALASAVLRIVLVIGNSFLPLFLLSAVPDRAPALILVFLLVRDATSVLAGWAYSRRRAAPRLRPDVLLGLLLAVVGLLLLAVPLGNPVIIGLAAIAQGSAGALLMACTNLLAVHGAPRASYGIRNASNRYVPSLTAFVLPIVVGWAFDARGATAALLTAALTAAVLSTGTVLALVRLDLASPGEGVPGARPPGTDDDRSLDERAIY